MGKPFWLGIIGGIFGILAGIGVALIGRNTWRFFRYVAHRFSAS